MWLERFDPFKEFDRLNEDLNWFFRASPVLRNKGEQPLETPAWVPSVDIYEDGDQVVLKAELPGIQADKVDIRVEENVLTLKGERKLDFEEKKENYQRVERYFGTFQRSFSLPKYVDADRIRAESRDGVLNVYLPKKPETKPKQIKIDVK